MRASKGLTTQSKNLMKTLVILICSLSLALLHVSSAQEPQGPQGAKGKKKAASTQQGAPQGAKPVGKPQANKLAGPPPKTAQYGKAKGGAYQANKPAEYGKAKVKPWDNPRLSGNLQEFTLQKLANQGKLVSRQESPLRRSTSTFRNSQT